MLAIQDRPLYQNRLLLSVMAVLIGFVLTFALIRAFAPEDQQAARTRDTETSQETRGATTAEEKNGNNDKKTSSASSSTPNSSDTQQTAPAAANADGSSGTSWSGVPSYTQPSSGGSSPSGSTPSSSGTTNTGSSDGGSTSTGGSSSDDDGDGGLVECTLELIRLKKPCLDI